MTATPLKVLLAIEDRSTLRHCARLLSAFGHKVSSAASPALAADRLRADRPDVLVADGGSAAESALALYHAVAGEALPHDCFKLLLLHDPTPAELLNALEAGADDVLTTPLDVSELLARLRTAARVLEFERRLGRLAEREETTGLLHRQAFLSHLQAELQGTQRSRSPIACLVLQPDVYAELRAIHGLPAATRAMHELVARINQPEPRAFCGRIDAQRLALALPLTVEEALARAERLRTDVADAGLNLGDLKLTWTISLGMAIEGEATTATQLLERAEKALALAQHSGGNDVVRYEDVVQEDRRWSELAGGGLFAGAVLRNIMVPCPRLLRANDSLTQGDALLRQTRLPALPVIDDDGKLAGLLFANRAGLRVVTDTAVDLPVSGAMTKEAVSFDEATALSVLIDYFAQEAPPVVVVVHKGRPTGLVTPESLATLVEPLSTASFAPIRDAAGRSNLIVPHFSAAASD